MPAIPDMLRVLRDTFIVAPSSGQALMHDGTLWTNRAVTTADVTGLDAYLADKASLANDNDFTGGSAQRFRRTGDNAVTASIDGQTGVFTGVGSGLTSLPAGNLTGSIVDARLSANVMLLTGAQTVTGVKTIASQDAANPALIVKGAASQGVLQAWDDSANVRRATLRMDAVSGLGAGPSMDLGTGMLRANVIVSGQNQNTGLQVLSSAIRAFGSSLTVDNTFTGNGKATITAGDIGTGTPATQGVLTLKTSAGNSTGDNNRYPFVVNAPNDSAVAYISSSGQATFLGTENRFGSMNFGTVSGAAAMWRNGGVNTAGIRINSSDRILASGATDDGSSAFQIGGVLKVASSIGLATTSFGSGVGVFAMANRTTAPAVAPIGGGVFYAEAGALKYMGSSGTVTTIANA